MTLAQSRPRATRALVHLDSLRKNLRSVRSLLKPGTKVCAAVKADAYGHGAVPVARALRAGGVEYLGVATPSEGLELRAAGDRGPILLLGPALPEALAEAVDAGLEIMAGDAGYIHSILEILKNSGRKQKAFLHLKVDTGMSRFGCLPDEALNLARLIQDSPGLHLAGTATHFPVADSGEAADREFTQGQIRTMEELTAKMRGAGIDPGIVHAGNSGAIALHPRAVFDMVRPGLSLYGYGTELPDIRWEPVMELKTRISSLKKIPAGRTVSYGCTWTAREDTWIATVPAGYADGYPRILSNRASALINGCRYPVAGVICMDQCMLNLGPEKKVNLHDEVTLFGPDSRGPDAAELAALAQTIPYEITCGISSRVPRYYLDK